MPSTFQCLQTRWRESVVFRLSAVTAAIVVFVAITQASVGFQIYRLSDTHNSILRQSVPLLDKSQEFSRLMTTTLSQTTRLDELLSQVELEALRADYRENNRKSGNVLLEIEELIPVQTKTSELEASLKQFSELSEELFEIQLDQRRSEAALDVVATQVLRKSSQFSDLIDQLLITSTTRVLTISKKLGSSALTGGRSVDTFLDFAGEAEVLNALRSNIFDIVNLVQNHRTVPIGQAETRLANSLRFRIRSITQSLTLLRESNKRSELAVLTAELNEGLSGRNGLIAMIKEMSASSANFERIRSQQGVAIAEVDREVERVVTAATAVFNSDIKLAGRLITIIAWIGLITTFFVMIGIFLVNKFVMQRQISRRFTLLTEDVISISGGDYAHAVRVSGEDELGHIAYALDIFKEQAAGLERSNAELERFAYVAAHDLRSPLDAIQDLAKWTLEDAGDELSETCTQNLELLIKRSARLSTLQSDLLTYAQAGTKDKGVTPLHLANEIGGIADMVDPLNKFQIELINDPGEIVTYGIPLCQILMNLITNAIKHHDRELGKISVTFSQRDDKLRFEVEDDGPGIEPQFQAQIFELFKTLKSRDRVEGSGLGLALISKLVESFGGMVEVQSNAPHHRGSKFVFELPDLSKREFMEQAA